MCWSCENPDGDFATELIEGFDLHRWQLVGVDAGPNEPAFVYTVGLPLRFDHPELIMGGPVPTVGPILNAIVEYIESSDRSLLPGQTMRLGDDHYFGFSQVDPARTDPSSPEGSEIAFSDEVHRRLGVAPLGAVEVIAISMPSFCAYHFDEAIHDWLDA